MKQRITISILLFVSASYVTGCGPQLRVPKASETTIQQEREKQLELAFKLRMERIQQLFRVYTPLRIQGAELCEKDVRPITGMYFVEANSFPDESRDLAKQVLGLRDGVKVLFVSPGSPAANAGILQGDVILNVALGIGVIPHVSFWSTLTADQVARSIEKSGYEAVTFLMQRSDKTLNVSVIPQPACRYAVQLVEKDIVNAFADGNEIAIMAGMLRFIKSDDELALVLGHELAHNALGHISRKRGNRAIGGLLGAVLDIGAAAAGVNTGGVGIKAGAQVGARAYSQAFEAEADYLGLYFVARAGFDVSRAPDFWRRMAMDHPGAIRENYLATHPSTPERAAALEESAKEIHSKLLREEQLVPSWLDVLRSEEHPDKEQAR